MLKICGRRSSFNVQKVLWLTREVHTRPLLMGYQLALADVPVGTSLYRYFALDIDHPDLPHVAAWYKRPQQRPA
jgi:glutathione S-transferase